MTPLLATSLILAATLILFISDRIRLDFVALTALLAFFYAGLLQPSELCAGFGDRAVIIICALFVVGEALAYTGIAESLGDQIIKVAGTGRVRLSLALMLAAAGLSAFMSSTGAVAMLLPVALRLASRAKVSPGLLLMPMAFATLFGGMLTLIGTPPNLIASAKLVASGQPALAFFSFTPMGLSLTVVGLLFLILFTPILLQAKPSGRERLMAEDDAMNAGPRVQELLQSYGLPGQTWRLRLRTNSPLVGKAIKDSKLRERGVDVLDIRRWETREEASEATVSPNDVLEAGMVLVLRGEAEAVTRIAAEEGLDIVPNEQPENEDLLSHSIGVAELIIAPRSSLIGQSIAQARLRDRTGLQVLGVLRLGQPLKEALALTPLRFGDSLLVQGRWDDIALLRERWRDGIVTDEPAELKESRLLAARAGAPKTLAIVATMLIVMSFGWVDNVAASISAALALIAFGCVPANQAYRSINLPSIVLIAAMLPAATALEKHGGVKLLSEVLVTHLGDSGPRAVIFGLFLLTSTLSSLMSNTATAVLITPVAIDTARSMGLAPQAFVLSVAFAASCAFATPMASPVNTLVLSAGGYRFSDYVKLGLPLQILFLFLCTLLLPYFVPLKPL